MNRSLVLSEPGAQGELTKVGFDRSAAVRLRFHPFLTPPRVDAARGALKLRMEGPNLVAESASLVRHVELRSGADALFFEEHAPPAPGVPRLVLANVRARAALGAAPLQAVAIDDDGNSVTLHIP